jgi:hypothetical protein
MGTEPKDVMSDHSAARRRGVPIVVIESEDHSALIGRAVDAMNGAAQVAWDIARGLRAANPAGQRALEALPFDGPTLQAESKSPSQMLGIVHELPTGTIIWCMNMHLFWRDESVLQGIQNCRDPFKASKRMLVCLALSAETLPAELKHDVVILEAEGPDGPRRIEIANAVLSSADCPILTKDQEVRVVDATRGLPSFAVEQSVAMALGKKGEAVDEARLWRRVIKSVNQTKGLSMTYADRPTFDDLGGLQTVKNYLLRRAAGRSPFGAVFHLDEVDKMMAGATGGDLSGTSTAQLGNFLTWMEDEGHDGIVAVGHPGSGKTALAMALGPTVRRPYLRGDLGASKGSLVGETEQKTRELFRRASSVAGGAIFVVATCNKMEFMPPEMRRRFKTGIWFFDMPDAAERRAIWLIHERRLGITIEEYGPRPADEGWSGAEIRNCCDIAWQLRISLEEASKYILPVSQSDPNAIAKLRQAAEGRWFSASYPGSYRRTREESTERMVMA